jgi:hypothetical protein
MVTTPYWIGCVPTWHETWASPVSCAIDAGNVVVVVLVVGMVGNVLVVGVVVVVVTPAQAARQA